MDLLSVSISVPPTPASESSKTTAWRSLLTTKVTEPPPPTSHLPKLNVLSETPPRIKLPETPKTLSSMPSVSSAVNSKNPLSRRI